VPLDAREGGDAGRLAHRDRRVEPEDRREQRDVLPSSELDVEACADL
jgi:hypothetical protein